MKAAIVTGCEGQIGQVIVNVLKEQGYFVIGFDLVDATKAAQLDEFYKVDITCADQIRLALQQIIAPIGLLINNAGVSVFTKFEDRKPEEISYVLDVNIKGTILMTQAVFNNYFKKQKDGCIVNIGSIYGVCSGDMRLYREGDRRTPEVYGASKAAVINLTKYFSTYMAPYNVRVNCISPGGVFNKQDKEFVEKYSNKVPMGRMAHDYELVSTLRYLINDESTYVTGQNIVVDGGFTAW
ncbi:MAG: SDR family oxidoreductase [Gammaproteobacteria bacterium]|nr:SDR family oxidoreductase [Gammaproteobacteria bacterium]MCH9743470.1 SDR family oxidoreductase [Gammaproteobacteria bacterium]